jgi:hypothetical protein
MNTQENAANADATAIDAPDTAAVAPAADPNTVVLDSHIVRGKQLITSVSFRRPSSGELRGLTLNALANLDVVALTQLIPRISSPMVTRQEAEAMDPADLLQCGGVIGGFLLPKHAKANIDSQTM